MKNKGFRIRYNPVRDFFPLFFRNLSPRSGWYFFSLFSSVCEAVSISHSCKNFIRIFHFAHTHIFLFYLSVLSLSSPLSHLSFQISFHISPHYFSPAIRYHLKNNGKRKERTIFLCYLSIIYLYFLKQYTHSLSGFFIYFFGT